MIEQHVFCDRCNVEIPNDPPIRREIFCTACMQELEDIIYDLAYYEPDDEVFKAAKEKARRIVS